MSDWAFLIVFFVVILGAYTLNICFRDFRRTRRSGTLKPYLYLLGALFSLGLILLALAGGLLIFIGPLH